METMDLSGKIDPESVGYELTLTECRNAPGSPTVRFDLLQVHVDGKDDAGIPFRVETRFGQNALSDNRKFFDTRIIFGQITFLAEENGPLYMANGVKTVDEMYNLRYELKNQGTLHRSILGIREEMLQQFVRQFPDVARRAMLPLNS